MRAMSSKASMAIDTLDMFWFHFGHLVSCLVHQDTPENPSNAVEYGEETPNSLTNKFVVVDERLAKCFIEC